MNFINSPKNCTEVRFASFFPSGFITAKVVNPPKRELTGIKKPTGKVGKVQNLTSEGISSPSPEEDNLCLRVTSSMEPVEDTEAILDNAEELKNEMKLCFFKCNELASHF